MKNIPDSLSDMDDVKKLRVGELSRMLSPHFASIKNYQSLIMYLVKLLGDHKPLNDKDRTIRNLIADCDDMIDSISPILKEGKHNVATVLIRRLYENTSLINAFILDDELHSKWQSGEEVPNREVRKILDKSILGAKAQSTKQIYYELSNSSHPSRVAIMDRFLGEGIEFTLGGYITPSVYFISESLYQCLSLIFWLCATVFLFYKSLIINNQPDLINLYKYVSEHAQKINEQLHNELERLSTEDNITYIQPKKRGNKKKPG